MSSHKKYMSGSQKRKLKETKAAQLQSLPKLTTFLKPKPKEDSEPSTSDGKLPGDDHDEARSAESQSQILSESAMEVEVPPVIEASSDSSQLTDKKHSVEQDVSADLCVSSDPADWQIIDDKLIEYLVNHPLDQNCEQGDFSKSARSVGEGEKERVRYVPISLFTRKMANDEKVKREWLVYSPKTGDVFCVPCKLFSKQVSLFTSGFSDWKNCQRRVAEHESSKEHKNSVTAWGVRAVAASRIDSTLALQVEVERKYWREVLLRIVETLKFLTSRGLPLRGSDERIGSSNNGNYLGVLELLAKFDPLLAQHLGKYGAVGSGKTSYLSKTISDDMINLMAEEIHSVIISEVKQAKYYSVSVDSTPDVSHTDQLTFIVRYVKPDGKPVERFLKFIDIHDHGAESIASTVVQLIEDVGLDLRDMRGQSYDNAANMSGIYTGLQARIKAMNPLAYYVPCAGHSLNLVGTSAASSCLASVSYFSFLQALYNFFSASTYRWDHLKAALPAAGIVLKSLSDTRWSARADAVKAVFLHYHEIKSALENICSDSRQTVATKLEGEGLRKQMESFETALLTVIWYKILTRFNATSLSLQKVETDLLSVVNLYESLISFISEMRQRQFDEIEDQARTFAEPIYTDTKKRTKKRKKFFDESVGIETHLDPRQKFMVDNFYTILDCLRNELERRVNAYSEIKKLFSFLTEYDSMNYDDLKAQLELLVSTYSSDLEASVLDEFLQFKDILSSESDRSVTNISTLLRSKDGILTTAFPNISILVRMFLTIPITNCQGERSFSTLSRVKNHLRSTLGQTRLNSLSLLCIESDLLQSLDTNSIIDKFAIEKSRKKSF